MTAKKKMLEELDDGMFDKIRQELSNINITEQEINEFLNSDNENSPEFIEATMECYHWKQLWWKAWNWNSTKQWWYKKFPLMD